MISVTLVIVAAKYKAEIAVQKNKEWS